ncbi:MAG: filamentous hemagglutinin N-terminal domain-containing protein, partial [Nitrospina sp.]|nr:filamentous hemagglutinin N-terminal domain-containing protein [Nitrospina sp.]
MISEPSKNLSRIRLFSRKTKRKSLLFLRHLVVVFLIWLIGGFPTLVYALPEDGQIVSGSGTITEPTATSMQIDQFTGEMIINWNSFIIGGSESVNFTQPSSSAIALNRVIGTDPSLLLGNLTANGQVFIVNGSGVFFGPGSKIDTHGLIATTMGISDQDFLDQNYNFSQDIDNPLTSVINEGTISTTSYVGLLAPAVANRGTIVASLGSVDLAAGKAATLDFTGDGLISFEVTEAVSGTVTDKDGNVLQDRVSNSGLIQADGGQVRMTAKDAGDVIRHVVNMEGTIQANTVVEKEGRVFLTGGSSGVVNVSGTITASGDDVGEEGGTVHVLGEMVGLFDNAVVNVSGDAGGGEVLIGGDFQGKNAEVQNAFRTYVGEDAVIDASAGTSGDGGKVIVWADDVTRFYGSVLATGGSLSGDGGFVEVSGKGTLNFHALQIALGAVNGVDGVLLLDPLNITISSSADSNTAGFTAGSDDTEAFAEDSGLTSNFDVTASSGSFNGVTGTIELQATNDITVSAAWNIATSTGNSNVSVVLRAGNDINIDQAITLDGTGTLTIEADGNTANGAGDLVFGASGSFTTGGGNIDITANDIDLTSGSINAGAGTVTLLVSDGGAIALGASGVGMVISGTELQNITATNLTIGDATNGDITVEGITGANTINITGLTTLNANNTGASINFSSTASIFTNALTLNANFGVTMNVSLTVGGAIVLDSDSDNNGAGDFSVADGQTVNSSNNSLTITANDINLNTSGALNTGSGDITILVSDGGTIGVGAASGDMQITDAELGNITANNLTIGDSTGGNISISTVTAANTNTISGTITLDASGSGKLISTDNSTSVFENALTLTANTSITVAGDLSTNQGDLNFNGAMIIGEANTPTVSTGAGAGDITVTGAITGTTGGSAETLILLAGTGAVTLAAVGAGDTTGLVNFTISSSGSATFGGAVNLPTPGVLAVTSTGDITGTAASITVVATSSFTTSGTGTITLTNASNVFTGGITLSSGTGAVQLTDSSATILATSTLGGNLTVTSSGAITQAGSLTVSGTSSFTSTGGDITLTDGSNDLGANLTLDVNNSFNVVTTSTLTDLTLTVSSSSSSTYALSASNISAFNLSDTGSNIQIGTLTATALNFGLTVDTDTVTTSGAMSVGTGSLSVTTSEPSGNGSITISNTLAAGSLTLDANGQQLDVNINNVVTIASGGAVTLTADDAINFSSSGSITASGAGNISLQSNTDALAGGSDAIAMTDGSTIDAGSGTLTLTSTGANSGDITVGELTTTNSTASAVTVTADAAIVDGGDTDVDIVATSGTINLIGATSIGSGDAIETNTAVLVLDSNGGIEIANTTTTLTDLTMTIDPASNPTYALSSTGLTTFSLAASGGDITTFVVDSSTALNFSLNTDTGSITTSGAMDVGTGSFSLTNNDTGTGSAINFSNTLAAGSLILDANGQFSDINISAALAITSAGAVTLTADDAVNINSGGSITASGAGNVSITANDVTTDGNSFDVIQMSSGTSIDAGSGTITLSAVGTNATNNTLRQLTTTNSSSTALVINALGNVAFNDTVNVTGDISVTSSGNISQTAALTIGGASSFDTSASTGTITLTNTSNDFTGAVTLASGTGAVQIFDSATLILATSTTLGGNLTASADNGLTISGDLTSTGNMTLEGDANNSSDGTDNISITSGVTLNSGGTLTMDATTGGITAVGSAVFTATSGITINDTLSVSTGTVTFNNAASIAGLSLTAGTIDGAGDITVTGAMTWSGGTISGTRTLTTDTGVTTTMSASSAATLDTNVTWENDGTIDWNFSSSDFAIDGTLNNKSGADFNLQHTTNNADITGSGTVNNLSGAT